MTSTPMPGARPLRSVCILRLSALGDVVHAVSVVRSLQRRHPGVSITWIIGRAEARLLQGLDGVEFIVFDKRGGLGALQSLRRALFGRRFDVLLHMQLALRANLLSLFVRAPLRIGFDAARSKEGHGWVVNRRIAPGGMHVRDVLGHFAEVLGAAPGPVEWRLPITDEARAWAETQLPAGPPALLVSPCSSHRLRNWRPDRYAAVMAHALARGWRVMLCGGPSALERQVGDAILASLPQPSGVQDLIGKDTFARFLALCQRAALLLAPDSGPVHMADAVGCRVLGLYACTSLQRSGPYSDRRWSTDHYAEAAERFLRQPASTLAWGKRIEMPGVMDLCTVEEVISLFDACAADMGRSTNSDIWPDHTPSQTPSHTPG